MSRSQTIGNQTSSLRSANQANGVTGIRLKIIELTHAAEELSRVDLGWVGQADAMSRICTTSRKMGIHVSGLPETTKVEKLEKFMVSDKAPHRRCSISTRLCEAEFHLHYYQWSSGKTTTGEGVYFCDGSRGLEKLSGLIDGCRIDKKHNPIRACVAPVCFDCHFPLDCEDTPPHLLSSNLEKVSTLDRNVCEMCLPSPIHCCCCNSIITEEDDPNNMAKVFGQIACRSCREDSSLQEKWRYNDKNKLINDVKSSYVEKLYLSDEAIEREKELMGGEPPKPCKDNTPFLETCPIRDLIDPKSRDYWPFGMSAQQYLEHKELMRFNNPFEETPDETWREINVSEEVLSTYSQDLRNAIKKFNYSEEDRGTLPAEIVTQDCKYRLIEQCHGFTCDSPVCQAVFQHQHETDAGAFSALVATGIPMFTTRPGDIYGSPREAGFGHERCIACVSKVIPDNFRISDNSTFYSNSVKTARFTTDKKL